MNNLSSYCGLLDAKIRASDKDLPVTRKLFSKQFIKNMFTIDKIKPIYIVLNQTSENVKLEQDIPDDDYFDETIENNMAFNLEINAADKEILLVYKGGLISESFSLAISSKQCAKLPASILCKKIEDTDLACCFEETT